jgi:MATE family multidrug resistance protein
VDTAFVEDLGTAAVAALGAATILISSGLWVFNFLGVGTQTQVAQALGSGRPDRARETTALAASLALLLGVALLAVAWGGAPALLAWMSDDPDVRELGLAYLRVRLLGAPAGLVVVALLGTLRGLQRMRAALLVAAGMSLLNVALDPLLIFGAGPIPALGVAGAAWATTASQLAGVVAAAWLTLRDLGRGFRVPWARSAELLVVGRDMVLRTGALLLFLLMASRASLQAGVDAGAAHQAIRQVWLLSALLLDAFATTAQSLIGWFLGAGAIPLARRVASRCCAWGLAVGVLLGAALLLLEDATAAALVPPGARAAFAGAWWISALAQPLNSLSFVTDGIHWGTGQVCIESLHGWSGQKETRGTFARCLCHLRNRTVPERPQQLDDQCRSPPEFVLAWR